MKGLKGTEIYNNIIGMDILKYIRSLGLKTETTNKILSLIKREQKKKIDAEAKTQRKMISYLMKQHEIDKEKKIKTKIKGLYKGVYKITTNLLKEKETEEKLKQNKTKKKYNQ